MKYRQHLEVVIIQTIELTYIRPTNMIHHNKWTLRGILLGSPRFDQSWDRIIRAFDLVNCSSTSDAHGTLNPIRVVVEKSKFVTKFKKKNPNTTYSVIPYLCDLPHF